MNKQNNKKSRTLINLFGLPSIIYIIYNGGLLFKFFIFIVIILGIYELSKIASYKDYSINIIFMYSYVFFLFFLKDFITYDEISLLIISFLFLCIYEVFISRDNPLSNISITIFGLVWIVFFFEKIIDIRNLIGGYELTLCMFLSVWACDSAAFYFGSKFGKKKILEHISPNKTWLGTISGLISSILVVYILINIGFLKSVSYSFNFLDILIMGFIFGGIGQLGDFFESLIKREFGIKDSGNILQGHGGVLDRFDSLFFVIPSFYLYIISFIMTN